MARTSRYRSAAIVAACFGSSFIAVAAAYAQDTASPPSDSTAAPQVAQEPAIGEIVVTARRNAESLVKVPVAVTALSSQTLVQNNVTTLQGVAKLVPFVTLAKFSAGNGALLAIRGIGSTPSDAGVQQSVLVNVDNVLIGRGRLIQAGLFDMQQIEVLKGPQALFYGKNSPAGVVSITSADPGNRFEASARAGYEFNARERYIEAAAGGPVSDTLKARLAVRYAAMDGWIKNVAVPRSYPATATYAPWIAAGASPPGASTRRWPADTDYNARLTLIWTPTPKLNVKFKYTYTYGTTHGDGEAAIALCNGGPTQVYSFGVADVQSRCTLADFGRVTAASDFPAVLTKGQNNGNNGVPFGRLPISIVSLNVNYDINDNLALTAITGFYDLVNNSAYTPNATSIAASWSALHEHTSSISEELRLTSRFDGPLNFVLGGYVDRVHLYTHNASDIIPLPVDPATGSYYTYDRIINYVSKSASVFGQLRWNIVPNLEIAGGVRYTYDKRDSTDGVIYANPAFAANLRKVGDLLVRQFVGTNYSPEATLTWHPTPDQTLYAAYKTGYKSGGFSYPAVFLPSYTASNTSFLPETSHGFEIGYKARLLDGRALLQVALFDTTYQNLQISSYYAPLNSFVVSNAGGSKTKGIEVQGEFQPTRELNLHGQIGYDDAKYTSFLAGPCLNGAPATCTANLSGRPLPRAPKWQGGFGFTFTQPVGNDLQIRLNGDANFSSAYYTEDNLDPRSMQKSYWQLNAGIAVGAEDGRWRVSLQGRNLTDTIYNSYSSDMSRAVPGDYTAVPSRGRQIAIETSVKF